MGHAVEDMRAVSEVPGPEVVMAAGDLGVAAPYDGWPAETVSLSGEITLSVGTRRGACSDGPRAGRISAELDDVECAARGPARCPRA